MNLRFQTIIFACLAFSLTSTIVIAAEPADSAISSAMDDMTRLEQQVAGSPSKSTLNRTLKLLTITRQRLDSSTNQSDPSWIEADQRYKALVEQIEGALSGGQPAAATVQKPATAVQTTTPSPTPSATGSTASRELISQDYVRLKKLKRDIESTTQSMDQAGIKPWQDPAYAAQYQQAAERYEAQYNNYAEFADQAEVQEVAAALAAMNRLIEVGLSEGGKAREAGGDVQARLAGLYQRVGESNPPPAPDPLTPAGLEAWLSDLARIRQQAAADYQELAEIKENAYLPNNVGTVESGADFDMQNVDSMMRGLESNVRDLDNSIEQLAANLDLQMEQTSSTLDFYAALDPGNEKDRSNLFLGEGQLAENTAVLDKEIAGISAALAFDEALSRDTAASKQALLSRAQQVRADYISKRQAALEQSRMPEPASEDDELIEIAEETLKNPSYEVGEYLQLVVNADIAHHEKESSELEFDDIDVSLSGDITLTGTETTTFFEWDQFQVATAERVGDKVFIFYNTLRKFTRGGPTTPLNRWLVSARFQGSEILEENVDSGWW